MCLRLNILRGEMCSMAKCILHGRVQVLTRSDTAVQRPPYPEAGPATEDTDMPPDAPPGGYPPHSQARVSLI